MIPLLHSLSAIGRRLLQQPNTIKSFANSGVATACNGQLAQRWRHKRNLLPLFNLSINRRVGLLLNPHTHQASCIVIDTDKSPARLGWRFKINPWRIPAPLENTACRQHTAHGSRTTAPLFFPAASFPSRASDLHNIDLLIRLHHPGPALALTHALTPSRRNLCYIPMGETRHQP